MIKVRALDRVETRLRDLRRDLETVADCLEESSRVFKHMVNGASSADRVGGRLHNLFRGGEGLHDRCRCRDACLRSSTPF